VVPVNHRIVLTSLAVSVVLGRPGAQSVAPSWSEPFNLGAPVNSAFQESTPAVSADGSSLYFSSTRPCGDGDTVPDLNLWVARRSAPSGPWATECLRINVDGYIDSAPDLSPDGLWLYFSSDRPGSTGIQRDIWVSRRRDPGDDQAWSLPRNLGVPVNTNAPEIGPSYFVTRESRYLGLLPKQKLMFSRPTAGNFDLWEADMLDDLAFGTTRRIDAFGTEEFWESGASVSTDGLELFFNRAIPNGPFDIFFSTRRDASLPWSTPVSLGAPVNLPSSSDAGAAPSPDGALLYFESNRPGGFGNSDIWVSMRTSNR
jgi:Tol biopolymer transport system component